MKLSDARFCPECSEIFEIKKSVDRKSCPSCTNRFTVLLSWFILKASEKLKGDKINEDD